MADDTKKRQAEERKELAVLDAAGLQEQLGQEQQRLFDLRFQHGKRQLEDTSAMAKSRKRIARIKTYLRAQEMQKQS